MNLNGLEEEEERGEAAAGDGRGCRDNLVVGGWWPVVEGRMLESGEWTEAEEGRTDRVMPPAEDDDDDWPWEVRFETDDGGRVGREVDVTGAGGAERNRW